MPEPGAVGPVPLFFPPFPNEEKMRRGRLNVERPLGGLGESHSVRGEWFLFGVSSVGGGLFLHLILQLSLCIGINIGLRFIPASSPG